MTNVLIVFNIQSLKIKFYSTPLDAGNLPMIHLLLEYTFY